MIIDKSCGILDSDIYPTLSIIEDDYDKIIIHKNASFINGDITGVTYISNNKSWRHSVPSISKKIILLRLLSISPEYVLSNREIILMQLINAGVSGVEVLTTETDAYLIIEEKLKFDIARKLIEILGRREVTDYLEVGGNTIVHNMSMVDVVLAKKGCSYLMYDQSEKSSYIVTVNRNVLLERTNGILYKTKNNQNMEDSVFSYDFKGVAGELPKREKLITYKNMSEIVNKNSSIFSLIQKLKLRVRV
jgi:hypothetical protein